MDREFTLALTRALRGARESTAAAPVPQAGSWSSPARAPGAGGDPLSFLFPPEPSAFGNPKPQPAQPEPPQAPPASQFDQQVAQLLGVEVAAWMATPEPVKAAVIRLLAALTQRAPGAADDPEAQPPAAFAG